MENLEPWNMFTNDLVAEENDEIVTGNEFSDYQESVMISDVAVKAEPLELSSDNENYIGDVECSTTNRISVEENNQTHAGEENDSADFNFDFEAQRSDNNKLLKVKSINAINNDVALIQEDSSESQTSAEVDYEKGIMYICPACGVQFDKHFFWRRHMNTTHNFNTKIGLNFVRIDKLYHKCIECDKQIAMHSMENLIKHKFTHLPYRCCKCRVCGRQYKYRQDLLGHLRMVHRQEMQNFNDKQINISCNDNSNSQLSNNSANNIKDTTNELTNDDASNVEIRNELLEPTDYDGPQNPFLLQSLLEDTLSQSSSKASENQFQKRFGADGNSNASGIDRELNREFALYICPQCGKQIEGKTEWRKHFEIVHFLNTPEGLNFENNYCLECDKEIPTNTIENMQKHAFTHLPHKFLLRCKLCSRNFGTEKDLVSHFKSVHPQNNIYLGISNADIEDEDSTGVELEDVEDDANDGDRTTGKVDVWADKIDYLCPQCGDEFLTKKQWRKHINIKHDFSTMDGLRFKDINDKNLMCIDCLKVITNAYGIQNAQQHRFTHLPYKAYIRCRICQKSYTERKGLVKHLTSKHSSKKKETSINKNTKEKSSVAAPLLNSSTSQHSTLNHSISTHATSTPSTPVPPTPAPSKAVPSIQLPSTQDPLTIDHSKANHLTLVGLTPVHTVKNHSLPSQLKITHSTPMKSANIQHSFTPITASRQQPDKEPLLRTVRRETVRHKNFIFEIRHLEEYFEDENNVSYNASNQRTRNIDTVAPAPKLNYSNKLEDQDLKCFDCGSIFSNQQTLRAHMKEEHEFVDYNQEGSANGSSTKRSINEPNSSRGNLIRVRNPAELLEDNSNAIDTNELLVPIKDDDLNSGPPPIVSSAIEENYCLLCPACGEEFKVQSDWRRHINDVHQFDDRSVLSFRQIDNNRFVCTICNEMVLGPKLKGLQDHKFRHLPFKTYIKCLLCSCCYNHKPNMLNHLRTRHNIVDGRANAPSLPKFDYNYKNYQNSVVESSKPPMPVAISSSVLSKPIPCVIRKNEDSYHKAVDPETILYFCPKCNENFRTHGLWRQHIVDAHKFNDVESLSFRKIDNHHYLCLHCYKRVRVSHSKGAIGQLQSHKFRHLPYKAFKCMKCKEEFVRKQAFFKHLNRDTNSCGNSVVQKNVDTSSYENDFEVRRGTKTYSKSPLPSTSRTAVDRNDYIVENDPKYAVLLDTSYSLNCPQCGKKYKSQRTWRDHINIDHRLNQRDVLNFRRVHSHLHICLQCNHAVNGNKLRDLQSHKFKHLPFGNSYIYCNYCPSTNQYIKNMKSHIMVRHRNLLKELLLNEPMETQVDNDIDDENIPMDEDSIVVSNEGDANDDDMQGTPYDGAEVIDVDAEDNDYVVEVEREEDADDNDDYEDLTNEENSYLGDENTSMDEADDEQYLLG